MPSHVSTLELFFDLVFVDQRAEHALSHADEARRARMALRGYSFGHLIMIAGIVLLAAGMKELIAHLDEPAGLTRAALLGSGIALYLLGDALFRATMQIGLNLVRLLMSAVSLLCIGVGLWLSGLAELVALLLILAIAVLAEHGPRVERAEVAIT